MADDLRGITEKKMKNGCTAIMVRFKYDGTTFPIKNFSKLFGCENKTQARDRLNECKVMLSKNIDPFITTPTTLTEIWEQRIIDKKITGRWNDLTIRNYNYFYYKHIDKAIGRKKLHRITYSHLEQIHKNMAEQQGGTKNRLQKLLYPIFEDGIKKGLVNKNIALDLEKHKIGKIKKIKDRTASSQLTIARALYQAIPLYQVHCKDQDLEIKTYLYMVVLSAHRIGELLQLKKENVIFKEKKIISPPEITKTSEEYHFPIPNKCLTYIDNIDSGLLFPTLKRGSIYNIFQRLVKIAEKIAKIEFYQGKTISPHDMRRIMLNIMVINCKTDSMLADSCLSHQQKGSTKNYVDFSDADTRGAYEKYWDIISLSEKKYNEKYNQPVNTNNPSVMNTTEKLIKLSEMLDRGLITEAEFKIQKNSLM